MQFAGLRLIIVRKLNPIAFPLILAGVTACGPSAVRMARPLPSQAPAPTTECERENTFELADTEMTVEGSKSYGIFIAPYSDKMQGLGVYRLGSEDLEELDDLWLRMDEPTLQVSHQARIQPVDDAAARVIYWSLGGIAVMGAGLGTAAALQDTNSTGAAVAGIGGLALGLTAAIIAIASQPDIPDQMAAHGRRYMFVPGEDDEAAMLRGVTKLTMSARRECD